MAELAEIEEMNRIENRIAIKVPNADLSLKQEPQSGLNIDWAGVTGVKATSTSIVLTASFVKGALLPKDIFKRQLQLKSICRILESATQVTAPGVGNASHSDNDVNQRGMIEVNIDEARRILKMRAEWIESGHSSSLLDSSVLWETEEVRYRRIQLGGVEDEGLCAVTVSIRLYIRF